MDTETLAKVLLGMFRDHPKAMSSAISELRYMDDTKFGDAVRAFLVELDPRTLVVVYAFLRATLEIDAATL